MRSLLIASGTLALLSLLPGCPTAVDKGESGADSGDTDTDTSSALDSDADTIPDDVEGTNDTDGDGTADYLDTDTDDDGVPDSVEAGDDDPETAPVDSDGDGSWDTRDPDSDNNCVEDALESGGSSPTDTDGDDVPDYADADNDGDGVPDEVEIGSTCYPADTDGDGTPDYLDEDSDDDGVSDEVEAASSPADPADTDGDGTPDYLDTDSDDDGIPDGIEGGGSGDPRDTDGDGTPDYLDSDSDADGLSDGDEAAGTTDPYDRDTDGDGETDGAEVVAGTDPADETSYTGDGYFELKKGENGDATIEHILASASLDVAFVLDDTAYNTTTRRGLADAMGDILDALSAEGDNFGYAFAAFEDYASASYGTAGYDLPYRMEQQITDSPAAIEAAIDGLGTRSGGDLTNSTHEALYQTLTGAGYDMDCDEEYDSRADVKPFIADPGDPFGGTGGQSYDASDDFAGYSGGVGFREGAQPMVVYFAYSYLRDPESGSTTYGGSPGGCPMDASESDVVSAATELGAYLIGVASRGSRGTDQMETLAKDTESLGDTDGDGRDDDPMVLEWDGTDGDELLDFILTGVDAAYGSLTYSSVSLVATDDPYGFVTAIAPTSVDVGPNDAGETVTFLVGLKGAVESTTEDQIFTLGFTILGDGAVELGTANLIVVVPAD